ncbi:lysophospholipid acyltransferase family protein [Actinotignum sanguinis]|uniref:Lysophospholipid acyltransferase family protein n=1 Tax=Actinotignum sanguinis TaxID=1445614 RepID=A0ABT5V4N4_9ACTO|nr:lysophospholipid acyltransferase family protein [Actinotignum sanguinis]MDE1655776.1 lysophospholipid acyltransferase family protein [Actinotignum sanguinis]
MSELEPIDPYLDDSKARRRHRVRRALTKPVMSTILRPTVLGEENIENLDGAFILVPNHSSHLDAPMIFSLLPDKLTERLATGAAADYFYRRRGISNLTSLFFNTYPIERGKKPTGKAGSEYQPGRAKGMTGRLLAAGVPILIFPEGTRSRTGELGTPKAGAAALAQRFNVPIVPIAMSGGHEVMPVGAVLPKFRGEVFLFIGRPMYGLAEEDPADFMGRVFTAIQMMLEQKSAHPLTPEGTSPFDAAQAGQAPTAGVAPEAGDPSEAGEAGEFPETE